MTHETDTSREMPAWLNPALLDSGLAHQMLASTEDVQATAWAVLDLMERVVPVVDACRTTRRQRRNVATT